MWKNTEVWPQEIGRKKWSSVSDKKEERSSFSENARLIHILWNSKTFVLSYLIWFMSMQKEWNWDFSTVEDVEGD